MSGRSRRWVVGVALCVYPLLVMARLLSPRGHSHLLDPTAPKNLLTDLDGAVWVTRILDHMPVPWAVSKMIGYPDGESLVRWQFFAQAMQWSALFLLTRVFPPVLSLNLFVLGGWIATGVAAYALARRLSMSWWASVAAAVLVQMLPAMPKMAANYTSYVFIGVPIYVVCRAIDLGTQPSRRNVVWLVGALGFTALFDAYWFYFSVAATALVLACNARTLVTWLRGGPRWARLVAILAMTIAVAFPVWLVASFGLSSGSNASRPVSVEGRAFVDAGLRMPWHWLRSSTEGVGFVIGGVGIATAVWLLVRRRDAASTSAAAVALLMMFMSTRTGIETPWFRIGSLAEYLRFVMPGVRFFQRAALIAEAMLCVFAVIGARDLARYVTRRVGSPRRALGLAVVVPLLTVTMFEFAPLDRPVSDRWDDFAEFRSILDESDRAVVLAVPFRRHGRDWLEFSMLDEVTTSNQLYSTEREDLTAVGSSHGPEAFAGYLASIGVTHVMSIVGPGGYPLQYRLEEPWFVPRSEMVLNAYENEPETVQLLEVRGDPTSSPIEGCPNRCVVGPGYPFLRTALEIVDLGGDGGDRAIDDDRSWWMVERKLTVQLSMVTLSTLGYAASVDIAIENPCGGAVEVGVTFDGQQRWLSVAAYETTDVSLGIDQTNLASFIEITSDGEPCAAGPDDADAHLRVFRPVLVDPVDR